MKLFNKVTAFISSLILIGNLGVTSKIYANPNLEGTRNRCLEVAKCAREDVELFLNLVESCSDYFKNVSYENKTLYQQFFQVLNMELVTLENLERHLSNKVVDKGYIWSCNLEEQIRFRYNMMMVVCLFMSMLKRSEVNLEKEKYNTIKMILIDIRRYFILWKNDRHATCLHSKSFYNYQIERINSALEKMQQVFGEDSNPDSIGIQN